MPAQISLAYGDWTLINSNIVVNHYGILLYLGFYQVGINGKSLSLRKTNSPN